ncbi:Hypothetical predicted protein [Mytilus galloprovincialis]|uniref:Uncharacterized protein n=1 Tax=Mytilus galloprovincialis TaxID=29158 RepID=A0A8B6FMP3_MYTGA|nr:Hypothetical predicted protein [Mytilus galloprovincialis]
MNQINSEQFDNFKSVAVALKLTVDGLQDFVHGKLRSLHQNIYRKCSMGQCKVDCSRRYGNEFVRWCKTCHAWKKELNQINRYRNHWDKIKWKKLDTMDFPFSHEEVAKVFVQDFTHVRQGVLEDLNALMSLFRNTKVFHRIVNDNLITDIQGLRNKYFAHNYSLSIHAVEKAQCYDLLIALLKIPDIACTQSSKIALNLLEEMKLSQNIPERILRKPDVQYTITVIQNISCRETIESTHDNGIAFLNLYDRVDNEQFDIKRSTELLKITQRNRKKMFRQFVFLLVLLSECTFTILYGLYSKETVPVKGLNNVQNKLIIDTKDGEVIN